VTAVSRRNDSLLDFGFVAEELTPLTTVTLATLSLLHSSTRTTLSANTEEEDARDDRTALTTDVPCCAFLASPLLLLLELLVLLLLLSSLSLSLSSRAAPRCFCGDCWLCAGDESGTSENGANPHSLGSSDGSSMLSRRDAPPGA
jgi:hypothetical protein